MSLYRQPRGYGAKPSFTRRLQKTLLALILLGGLFSAAFLFFFRGYVVETAAGPRLQLPFLAGSGQAVAASGEAVVSLPDTSAPTPAAADPLLLPLHALTLTQEDILAGDVPAQVEAAGCNAALFDLRGPEGSLAYVSALALAIEAEASDAKPGLNEAIREMNAHPDLYTIARVSCFPDETLGEAAPHLFLKRASGALWRDEGGAPWLSPASEEARGYLLDICRELAALGFDEILLTDCLYPAFSPEDGPQNARPDTFALTIEDFTGEIRRTLDAAGVKLGILWEPGEPQAPSRGQSLEALALAAHRVYCAQRRSEALETWVSSGISPKTLAPVFLLDAPGGEAESWVIPGATAD